MEKIYEENNKITKKNPHDICIWRPKTECSDCTLDEKLHCTINRKDSVLFGISFFIFLIPTIVGMIISGFGWWLIGYCVYWIFFFEFWENRVLCSHCPYYAEDGGKGHQLHCYANYGLYKTWSYNPKPMTKSHQIQFLLGVGILLGYPMPFLIVGGQYLALLVVVIGIILWLVILTKKICITCLNFSCPLNKVPKSIIDEFLKQNPVMEKAWVENGYILD